MKLLVVIDMQNDFINGSLGSAEAQAIVPRVVEKINNWNDPIIATRDTHYTLGSRSYGKTLEGKKLPVTHCIMNTPGWQLHKDIDAALLRKDSVDIQDKYTFGGFDMVNDQRYHSHFLESIEICGLCTDICVVSNALLFRAAFPDVPIICDASCCAGTTPENHQKALDIMKCCQIDIINA